MESWAVVLFSLLATWFLFRFMKNPLFDFSIFDNDILNFYLRYELSIIIVSLTFLFIIYLLADKIRLSYLNFNKIDEVVKPVPLFGINPKEGEGWKVIGLPLDR